MLTCVSFNKVQHAKVTQNMHNMTSIHLQYTVFIVLFLYIVWQMRVKIIPCAMIAGLYTGVFLSVVNSGLFMSDQNWPSIPYTVATRGLVHLRLWTLIRTELKLVWQRYWFSSHLLRWIRTCLLFVWFVCYSWSLSLIGRVMWPKLSGEFLPRFCSFEASVCLLFVPCTKKSNVICIETDYWVIQAANASLMTSRSSS